MLSAGHLPGRLYRWRLGLAVETGHSLWKAFRLRLAARRRRAANRFADLPGYLLDDAGIERRDIDWIADERTKRLRWGMNW
jgi:hypothetical protein